MASLVTAVFKYSIGALISKGRSMAAEKLKDGDVADAKLRQLIVKDMDDIKSKLEGISVKDLGASISFFNDAVVYLDKVLDKEGGLGTAEKNEVKTEADGATKAIKVKENDIVPLMKGVKSLNLVGLNEDAKSDIKQAEERFKDARKKAIEAFSNPALSTADRLLAMAIRIMATVLEQVGSPVSALDSLRYCLEELHSLSAVQENFSVLLKKSFKSIFGKDQRNEIVAFVCQMNRLIYDLTHEFVEDGRIYRQLFLWPSVEVGGEKIDLLREERIAKELRRMGMEQCCVQPWSFGVPYDKNWIPSKVGDIAINTKGHFIIACFDEVMHFDSGGNFLHSFPIPNIESGYCVRVETDQADNVYVLVRIGRKDGYVYIFDAQAKLHHSFKTRTGYFVHSLMVDSRGNVLVSMTEDRAEVSKEMYYYAHKDRFKVVLNVQVFSKTGERLNSVDVLCHGESSLLCTIREGRVLVLDDKDSILHSVGIEDNVDHKKEKIQLQEGMRPRFMNFHQPSELLFILSECDGNGRRVSMYSKDGEYLRTILLNVGCEFEDITAFAVTNDGHFALGLWKTYTEGNVVCVI